MYKYFGQLYTFDICFKFLLENILYPSWEKAKLCAFCFDNTYFDNMLLLSYQSGKRIPATIKQLPLYKRNPLMGAIKLKNIYLYKIEIETTVRPNNMSIHA